MSDIGFFSGLIGGGSVGSFGVAEDAVEDDVEDVLGLLFVRLVAAGEVGG